MIRGNLNATQGADGKVRIRKYLVCLYYGPKAYLVEENERMMMMMSRAPHQDIL